MKSLLTLRVERDRAVTGSSGRHTHHRGEVHTRYGSIMELVIGKFADHVLFSHWLSRNQIPKIDGLTRIACSATVIVHHERESPFRMPLRLPGGADLSSTQWSEAARVIAVP